ncbi:hypothetical protein [Kibdelosporangium aridum]|nr:hypothetical protein [Kibdelosporangium aridum]
MAAWWPRTVGALASSAGRQPILQRLTLRRKERFEEIITWSLWKFDLPVTLGEPGTKLPRLGAVREYHSDDNWEAAVAALVERSSAIVLMVGRSSSLRDEIKLIRAKQALSKTIFVLPPAPYRELRIRLSVLCSALDVDPACIPTANLAHDAVLVLSFTNDGEITLATARSREDIAYQAAIESAMASIVGSPRQPVSDPEFAVRRPGTDAAGLLRRSPTAVQARRIRRARRFGTWPWIASLVLSFASSLLFAQPAVPASTPPPGMVLLSQSLPSAGDVSVGHRPRPERVGHEDRGAHPFARAPSRTTAQGSQ